MFRNNYYIKLLFTVIFFLVFSKSSSQTTDRQKNLQERVTENLELFKINQEGAFSDTSDLLREAILIKDYNSELILLNRICWYYNRTVDIDNLISSAKLLQTKAIEYNNRRFQAEAHNYFLSVYSNNHLYEKALVEFQNAITLLEKEDGEDIDVIMAKNRSYVYLANLYVYREEPEKVLQYTIAAANECEKIKDPDQKRELQYRNYSNIAFCYLKINIDSTEYYVQKSMNIKSKNIPENDYITCVNYIILGDIRSFHKNYQEALAYYHKAELMMPNNNNSILNQAELFQRLQETYEAISDTINSNKYALKAKEIGFSISQNKYKSLHKILQDDTPKKDDTKIYIVVLSLALILVLVVFVYRLKKKNKLFLKDQERESQEYLEHEESFFANNNREQLHKDLIEMIKNNNPDFMKEFLRVFPDFIEKISLINPSIRENDIEFCAFLKLSLPTKEIAKLKNLAPRTIHNRKYRIRKKLNIPDNIDIYYWFSLF